MRLRHLFWSLILLAAAALPARAELVFFSNGQAMSVRGHEVDGDTIILTMRNGGSISFDLALVVRITPDEVSHEEEGIGDSGLGIRERANRQAPVPEPAKVDDRYSDVIERASAAERVDPRLVRAVIQVESAFQQDARSPKGAVGLMQLMPATARQYTRANPYDPAANIEAGVKHLRVLLDRFPLALALAAYNAGEAAVQRFRGMPPYPETQQYVARILELIGR